ncbi:E3 ubiquitin-protein ligase RNF113A-like [Tubulanus polymorphus]|uniref:E3 ubiquitin-protein ligase RNF113A-like n=1 Tax=Tubulanus polymorphus TaxID=672921 RepID=UPI003DA683B1
MADDSKDIAQNSEKPCKFVFKKRAKSRQIARKRKESSSSDGDSDGFDSTTVVKRVKSSSSANPMIQGSKVVLKKETVTYSDSDDEKASVGVSYKSSRSGVTSGPADMGATATVEIDTETDRDSRAVFERSLQTNKELKGKEDDKIYRGINNYAQYYEKKDTAQGNAASGSVRQGPMRAPANLRATVRWDYAPDICKDYKETGFCGFGDSCKFLHDRGDYKHGWQLEREERSANDDDDTKYEISSDEDELPFKCYICRNSFKTPIVTKCKHYFCEKCALDYYKKSKRCFVCGEQTSGIFNPAKELIAKMKLIEENEKVVDSDSDS